MKFYHTSLVIVFFFSCCCSADDSWISPEIFELPKQLLQKEKNKLQKIWSQKKEEQIRKMHYKLFDMFFPRKDLNLTLQQQKMAREIRLRIWKFIDKKEDARRGLLFFAAIPGLQFRSTEGAMRSYYSLLRSPIPYIQKIAKQFRYLYLLYIYGSELGKSLSQYHQKALPIFHPQLEEFTKDFREKYKFDQSSIVFDKQSSQVRLKNGEFDYAIVGSGTSGSVLAHQLRKNGKKVIVVERGSFAIPGAIDCVRIDQFKEKANIRTSVDGGIVIRNANVVGGGSAVNIDLAFAPTLPTVQAKIKHWRTQKYIAEDQFLPKEIQSAYQWVQNTLSTRKLSLKEINNNNKILWEGSHKLGWTPSLYDLNRYVHGEANHPVTDKVSSVEKLILPALTDSENPLYLLSDCAVQKILHTDGKAYGIEVKKLPSWYNKGIVADIHHLNIPSQTHFRIHAKQIILCAGALGSANILIRSDLHERNANIGQGIVLHPSMPLIGVFEKRIDAASGLTASVYNDHFAIKENFILEAMSAGPEYVALMVQGNGKKLANTVRQYPYLGGFGVMVVDQSTSSNRVFIDKQGKTQIDYRLTEHDKKTFRTGLKRSIRIMFAAGAKKVALPSAEILGPKQTFFDNEQQALAAVSKLEFDPNQTIVTSAHMQATNKMGTNPNSSVVDTNYRVRGMENLYVVDSSIFPTSVGANPMQMIYTVAKIFADKMNGL